MLVRLSLVFNFGEDVASANTYANFPGFIPGLLIVYF